MTGFSDYSENGVAAPSTVPKYSVLAVLSLIFTLFLPPLGVFFAVLALLRLPKTGERGKVMAIVSLILGSLATFFMVVVLVAGMVFVVPAVKEAAQAQSREAKAAVYVNLTLGSLSAYKQEFGAFPLSSEEASLYPLPLEGGDKVSVCYSSAFPADYTLKDITLVITVDGAFYFFTLDQGGVLTEASSMDCDPRHPNIGPTYTSERPPLTV